MLQSVGFAVCVRTLPSELEKAAAAAAKAKAVQAKANQQTFSPQRNTSRAPSAALLVLLLVGEAAAAAFIAAQTLLQTVIPKRSKLFPTILAVAAFGRRRPD